MKKAIALLLAALLAALCCGCGSSSGSSSPQAEPASGLDPSEEVTLTICGPWVDSKAFETIARTFNEKYPNCQVEYEYLQNFDKSAVTRLDTAPDTIDFIVCSNVQSDSPFYPYAEDLDAHPELDLSDTNPALIKNFTFITTDQSAPKQLYCIPLGGELRGMYVNKTLLASLGQEVPTNATEFLAVCQVLKDAGYVPVNGNPGYFASQLLYPYVCNLIANADNYQETYDRVNRCEPGVSKLFRAPMQFMYTLTENYYYNYKYVETELGMFTDNSNEGMARDFFNLKGSDGNYSKADDVGTVAFMVGVLSQNEAMQRIKEDYHSQIDYDFILSPVSDEGGFAYVSCAHGIAVNKNSAHLDWAIEFLNYLFTNEVNTQFAANSSFIPNTSDSFEAITSRFNVPANRVSDLGQATFDYSFYNIMNAALVTVAKCNNPKYMDTDSSGNPVLFSFDYYMEQLEAAFAAQRESLAQ